MSWARDQAVSAFAGVLVALSIIGAAGFFWFVLPRMLGLNE
jgi:hypothetical protein